MALTQWAILNSDGLPAGTQVCEGASCYPALQPGQSRVAMPSQGATPATPGVGGITTVDAAGRLVQPQAALPDLTAQPMPVNRNRAAPPMRGAAPTADIAAPTAPPQQPNMPAMTQGMATPQMQAPNLPNLPTARTAQMPGQQQGTPSYRPTISSDAGWAGPTSVGVFQGARVDNGNPQASSVDYPSGHPLTARAFDEHGRSIAERGTHTSPQYDAMRAKGQALADRVRQMASNLRNGGGQSATGGTSSGYSSSGYSTPNYGMQQRRQQRRYDRTQDRIGDAYDTYNEALGNPPPQEATGWARRELGKNRGNYPLLLTHPLEVMGKPLDVDPYKQMGTYDWMDRLPMADLAMITGSDHGKGLTRKSYVEPVPHLLKQQGVKPTKPDFAREFDYSKYAGQLRDMYNGLNGKAQVLNKDHLMTDLAQSKPHAGLRLGLDTQAHYGDVGGALDRAKGYFQSVFSATEDDLAAAVHSRMADRYFAQQGLINRKPEQIDNSLHRVAKRFGY